MNLSQLITFIDGIKPNSFTNDQKTQWVNEVEARIQTEIFLLGSIQTYVYAKTNTVNNVSFPDSATIVFESDCGFRKNGTLTITDLTDDYAVNNVIATILDISADGKTLTFAEDTFTYIGDDADGGTYTFDGSVVELLADTAHQKVYWAYLTAMIDFAFGEYAKFNNALTIYNDFFGEYSRWYARTYNPAKDWTAPEAITYPTSLYNKHITLEEMIDFVDGIKPNSFTDAQKTVWLNEVESLIQTDIYLLAPADVYTYVYSLSETINNVLFTDSATMVLEEATGFREYGTLTISGLTGDFEDNNVAAEILDISADGKTLTFAEGTFAYTSETDADGGTYSCDDSQVELLADPAHQKVYWAYLCAMIDFANQEYAKFNNAIQIFNDFFGEYSRWYARVYKPANGLAEADGYYLSAYGLAVKHGYGGTEEEWLLTLKGDTGDGLVILGLYATLADLQTAHATGEQGDCYAVGTAESNVLYIWDGTEWVNHGSLKGDKGDTGTGLEFNWSGTQLGIRQEGDIAYDYTDLAAQTYIHNQILASTDWIIDHELNRYPAVFIVDSGGSVVVGDILYTSTNTLQLHFSAAFSGKAYLN